MSGRTSTTTDRLWLPRPQVSDADFEDDGDRERTIEMARETLEAFQHGVSHEGVSTMVIVTLLGAVFAVP